MWEPETLDLQELGEHEGFDFEDTMEFDPFGDYENGASWEGESDLFDYEALGEASLESLEADPFIGNLVRSATRKLSRVTGGVINDQTLKNLARQAAQVAGGAIAGPQGAKVAGQIAGQVIREGDYEFSYEFSYESSFENDFESMLESAGVDMEAVADLHYFANRMAEAESQAEADEFLGALIPVLGQVAAPLISNLAGKRRESEGFDEESWGNEESRDEFLPALLPMAAPLIAKGVGALGQLLTRQRKTKKLAEATPQIAFEALNELTQRRYPLTRTGIASAVGSATARTLGSRQRLTSAVRKNQSMARRATGGRPPQYGMYGSSRSQSTNGWRGSYQRRGRMAPGSSHGRQQRIIGYVPVYAKR